METVLETMENAQKHRGRPRKAKEGVEVVQKEIVPKTPQETQNKGIVVWESEEFGTIEEFGARLRYEAKALELLREAVKDELKVGIDYGVIPGTPKPSLWKSGAEKIANFLGLVPDYLPTGNGKIEGNLLIREYKCVLKSRKSGKEMGSCIGSCNSYESKFRYRWIKLNDLPQDIRWKVKTEKAVSKQGNEYDKIIASPIPYKWGKFGITFRLDNENPYDLLNTIDKMAQKRAFVGAVINASRLSIDFTQDLEDLPKEVLNETEESQGKGLGTGTESQTVS